METHSVDLQRLADICRDAERELSAGADRLKNAAMQARLRMAATRYAAAAKEIDDVIEDLGGYPLTTGTLAGVQRLAIARIRTFFVADDDATVMLACEQSKELAAHFYEEAMGRDLPAFMSRILKRHYVGMVYDRDAMRQLRTAQSALDTISAAPTSRVDISDAALFAPAMEAASPSVRAD